MRERVTVVTLSVCLSMCHFMILEKVPFFKVETHFFENWSYFGEKESGTSAVTAVIYAGTAQSLNGLASELLAYGTFYQSCHSLHIVAGLQWLLSFPANSELVY